MKAWNFAILLLVFHTTISTKKEIKLDKTIAPLIKQCTKIKCPPVHKPVCARLTYNQTGIVVHAVLINKCEKKYVECYPDVQAKLVPMKFCSHDNVDTKGQKISAKEKSIDHKRVKRGIRRARLLREQDVLTTPTEIKTLELMEDTDEVTDLPLKYVSDTVLPRSSEKLGNLNLDAEVLNTQEIKGPAVFADSHKALSENEEGITESVNDLYELKGALDADGSNNNYNEEDSTNYESFDSDTDSKVDMDNYQAECPKVCPLRPVMVCGRCRHGIYTTFLSVCHMRMHVCSHKSDPIELVSRNPCMVLAPLLSMKGKQPLGKVDEPNDEDTVIRYIWCRERNNKGVYCNKGTKAYNSNLPMNAGADPVNPNLPMNAGADPVNPNLPMNAGADPDNPNLPMYAGADPDNPNLPMNAGADPVNPNLPMNAGADPDNPNLPLYAGILLPKKPPPFV